jgi:hypothetical protein
MDLPTLATVEYSFLTQEQQRRHGTLSSLEIENYSSPYWRTPAPTRGWTTMKPLQCIKNSEGNDGLIPFNLFQKAHFLLYTYMLANLPAVAVKTEYAEEYRISWPMRIAHHLINKTILSDGGKVRQTLNSIELDFHAAFFINQTPAYARSVGNVKKLTSWSNSLPSYQLSLTFPWFFSERTELAMPIGCEHEGGNAVQEIAFRLDLGDLLQMERFDAETEKWVRIKPDLNVINTSTNRKVIETPTLWGMYSQRTPEEEEHTKLNFPSTKIEYTDMLFEMHSDTKNSGSKFKLTFETSIPAENVFLGAYLARPFSVRGNYSNSLNENWIEDGDNPYKYFTFKYKENQKSPENSAAILYSHVYPSRHFPAQTHEPGYNALPLSLVQGDERQSGFSLAELRACVDIELDTMNSNYITDQPVQRPTEEFHIFYIVTVQRDITYTYNPELKKYVITSSDTEGVIRTQNSSQYASSQMSRPAPVQQYTQHSTPRGSLFLTQPGLGGPMTPTTYPDQVMDRNGHFYPQQRSYAPQSGMYPPQRNQYYEHDQAMLTQQMAAADISARGGNMYAPQPGAQHGAQHAAQHGAQHHIIPPSNPQIQPQQTPVPPVQPAQAQRVVPMRPTQNGR